ncbi:YciI family protein [Parathermosynechococcus lividus]
MTKFVVWGRYCEDVLERRAPHRQDHLDGLARQKDQGSLVTIGPTKDLRYFFAIYTAESEEAVRQLIEADPYWQHHVWTDYTIHEWIQAF